MNDEGVEVEANYTHAGGYYLDDMSYSASMYKSTPRHVPARRTTAMVESSPYFTGKYREVVATVYLYPYAWEEDTHNDAPKLVVNLPADKFYYDNAKGVFVYKVATTRADENSFWAGGSYMTCATTTHADTGRSKTDERKVLPFKIKQGQIVKEGQIELSSNLEIHYMEGDKTYRATYDNLAALWSNKDIQMLEVVIE